MIGISRCLLGFNCRYNGTNAKCDILLQNIKNKNKIFDICPEQQGGLSTPRNPSEIISLNPIKILTSKDIDVSKEFIKGTIHTIDLIKENKTKILILKSKSPSCGVHQIYDGTFTGNLKKGCGILLYLLKKENLNIKILDETDYLTSPFII